MICIPYPDPGPESNLKLRTQSALAVAHGQPESSQGLSGGARLVPHPAVGADARPCETMRGDMRRYEATGDDMRTLPQLC